MKRGFSRDKAILALQRAINATFDDGRSQELGCLVGKHNLVVGHGRLIALPPLERRGLRRMYF
jgi:hypothetical protein